VTPGSIATIFERAECRGWLCAIDIGSGRAVELDADEPVVAASVAKVPIALEFFGQVAAGRLDPAGRVLVRPGDRTPGPAGISNFDDPVEMSLRDLNRMMLVISDNAATDVVLARVGRAAVNATVTALGLTTTLIRQSLRELVDTVGRDLGFADWRSFTSTVDASSPEEVARLRARLPGISAMDPARTNATTAREMATLMSLVWRGQAGPPAARARTVSPIANGMCSY
jgi:beta-lactamase class A